MIYVKIQLYQICVYSLSLSLSLSPSPHPSSSLSSYTCRSTLISLCKKGDASALESQLQQITKDDRQTLLNTKDEVHTLLLMFVCSYSLVYYIQLYMHHLMYKILFLQKGTTPLHESCCQGNVECATVLLKSGADAIIWDVVCLHTHCLHMYIMIPCTQYHLPYARSIYRN